MANVMGIDPCDSQNHAIFNTTTQKRNCVDPRTGLFEVYVPLPSVIGNIGSGPVVDMSLFYTPVVNNFAALGDGWSFAFTTYHEAQQLLTLHSGEVLEIEKGKDFDSPAVFAKWSDGSSVLTVERKDGRSETLKPVGNSKLWVPEKLTTDGYNFLSLTWIVTPHLVGNAQHYQLQLMGLRDAYRQLLKVEYLLDKKDAATVKITFWPDEASETLSFTLTLKDYALRTVLAPDGNQSTFDYLENANCGWLLTSITTFEGLTEEVEYQDNGLSFADNAKLSALPCVSRHTLRPHGGGEAVVTTYQYKRNDEKSYSTVVKQGERTTMYNYNEKHAIVKEEALQGECSVIKRYVENEDSREVSTQYTQKDKKREENAKSSFKSGRLISCLLDGVRTDFLYKDLNNASTSEVGGFLAMASVLDRIKNPNTTYGIDDDKGYKGFLALSKERVSDGSYATFESSGDDRFCVSPGDLSFLGKEVRQAMLKFNGYGRVEGLNRMKPIFSVKVMNAGVDITSAAVVRQEIEYFSGNDFRKGRQRCIRQGCVDSAAMLLTDAEKIIAIDYKLDGVALTTTTAESRGGLTRSHAETHSILSGRLINQIDADGNQTTYEYDKFGRLIARTECAQSTTYKQTTRYAYPSTGRLEITDPNGLQHASEYDGQGKLIKEFIRDATDKEWRQILQVSYDNTGRKLRSTHFDYLDNGNQISEWCEFDYDGWGQECCRRYSNGWQRFNQYDPITRSRREWTGTSTDKHGKVSVYREDGNVVRMEWKDTEGKVYQAQDVTYTHAGRVATLNTNGVHGMHAVMYTHDGAGRVLAEKHEEKGLAKDDKSLSYTYRYTYLDDPLVGEAASIVIEFDGKSKALGERTFDAWGRVTSLTRAGITESFTYKGASPVPTSKKTADGKTLAYQYIAELGHRLAKVSEQGGKAEKSFAYAHGAVQGAMATEGERCLEFHHDLNGRLKKQRAQLNKGVDATVESQYSNGGRLLREKDTEGTDITYAYNLQGQRWKTVHGEVATNHSYDTIGRQKNEVVRQVAASIVVTYEHDAMHRETSRRFLLDEVFEFIVARSYHPDGRLKLVELKQKDGMVLGSRAFSYTAGGRLESCTTAGVWRPKNPKGKHVDKQVFAYDAIGNVISCVTTFGKECCTSVYNYDAASGCRLEKIENNHSDYPASATLSYDKAGRVIQDHTGRKYQYDWLGRLVQAGSRYYTYDPMDSLMACGSKDMQSQVLYSGLQVRGERESGTGDNGRHVIAGSGACTVQRVRRAGVKRTLIHLRDADGTVLVTHDLDAKTQAHHAYTAYGEHHSAEPESLLGYNGEYCDGDSGQYPLGQGYRWYDPGCQQFHAPDSLSPFGEGGPHAYGYCNGDPVNYQDRSGHAVGAGGVNQGLRRIWGDSLPGPVSLGQEGQLISTVIWSGVGVLTAIMTGGTSLLVWGASVVLALAASATAITSVAIADTHPEVAATLGWVSLAATLAVGGFALARKVGELALRLCRSGRALASKLYHKAVVALHRQRFVLNQPKAIYGARTSGLDFRNADEIAEALAPINLGLGDAETAGMFATNPPLINTGAIARLWEKTLGAFDVGDVNTMVCAITGVLGNAGYFETERDAFVNSQLNNAPSLPWGSFNIGRYGRFA